MSPDIAASVKARLLQKAHVKGEEFELFLVRYASERFLFRLGASPMRDRCILKGAGLLSIWMADPYRSTRDLDFLSFGQSDADAIRNLIETVCNQPCPEDGLRFDLDGLQIEPIREEQEYPGQRATMFAYLGSARIRVKVDFGFGDAVVPAPQVADYPTLLPSLPAPHVRIYPRELSIAEKFDAMVRYGLANSRMKDFHDVWALSSAFAFAGTELVESVRACFERRGTPVTPEIPTALTPRFYADASMAARWRAYVRSGAFHIAPPVDFGTIGTRVQSFLGPVRDSLVVAQPFNSQWSPGGSWA